MRTDSLAHARDYIEAGWSLCAIRPRSKEAYGSAWQKRPRLAEHWERNPDDGMGLIHGLSGTCSIDLDNLECATIALSAVGIDIQSLLRAPDAVRVIGKPGRGKLLYRAPEGLTRTALSWPSAETGKPFAVLELRGGSVQDVLPPSIHPDTGEPYRWEGDWRALPELPAELLAAWANWPAAKRDMEAACPWVDSPALSDRYEGVTRREYGEGESVIAAFNAAHQLRPILESFQYRKAGTRYISPYSESGIPGVVILPGSDGKLCYVHHASDPLADGHSHDAFSVWCQLEHGGDVTKAVRQAAEMCGISHAQSENKEGAELAARIMAPRVPPPPKRILPEAAEMPEAPSDPIPIPALHRLEYWLSVRHWGAKRSATTQGALAFAAAMTCRRYVTHEQQSTNLMLGVSDTSVAGLLPMRGALYEAAHKGKEIKIIRSEEITSGAALRRALFRHPRMFWASTDYGYMVSMQRKQTSGAFRSALDAIQEVYEGSSQFNLSSDLVGGKNVPPEDCCIISPGLSALILASDDQMRDIAQRSQYGRGAVQQILFVRASDSPGDEAGSHPGAPVPEDILETMEAFTKEDMFSTSLRNLASHPPAPKVVELGAGAYDALEEVRARLAGLFYEPRYLPWRGMAKGAFVTASRLSASLAAWQDPIRPMVTVDLVRWVSDWVSFHVHQAVEWYSVVASDDGEPSLLQEAQRLIFEAGPKGVTSSAMRDSSRMWKNTPANKRQEILEQLIEDGLCVSVPSEAGRTQLYVDCSYLKTQPVTK